MLGVIPIGPAQGGLRECLRRFFDGLRGSALPPAQVGRVPLGKVIGTWHLTRHLNLNLNLNLNVFTKSMDPAHRKFPHNTPDPYMVLGDEPYDYIQKFLSAFNTTLRLTPSGLGLPQSAWILFTHQWRWLPNQCLDTYQPT